MKRRITTLLLCAVVAAGAVAQKPTGVIKKVSDGVDIVLDGVVDAEWANATQFNVDKPFAAEVPTLGGVDETYWKGIWAPEGMYVLIVVTDDDWLPIFLGEGSNHWEYDKTEIYFDVNYELVDGIGGGGGNGHYQMAPAPADGAQDGFPIEEGGWTYAWLVTGSNYVMEYFVPWSVLVDKNGIGVDKTAEIGFDVTVIDRDAGDAARKRAVWANDVDPESYSSMDNCGIITFEGAEPGILVDVITLTAGDITENNGTVQIQAEVLPVDAENKGVSYKVVSGPGRATVDADGVVTAILDGDVTINGLAQDGGWAETDIVINISGQIVTIEEINVIKNPYFDDVQESGEAELWGGWAEHGDPMPQIVDGVAYMTPTLKLDGDPMQWHYQYNQNNLQALPNVDYEFSFVAWADEAATLPVDFEDIEGNGYRRYGVSTSPWAIAPGNEGRSEWHVPITTTATKYVMDVNFDDIKDNTNQKVQFMPGMLNFTVYVDSVVLVNNDDLALVTPHTPVEAITVSGGSAVTVGATLQMSATVLPGDATYTDVKWSVVPGTGWASIDAAGLLTGDTAGTVLVMASAVDDSRSFGELEVTVSSAVGISQSKVNSLKLYPNPAVNELNVVLSEGNSTVTIYNSVGMKVDEVIVTGNTHKFDVSSYASGLYFVKTVDSVAKFIK